MSRFASVAVIAVTVAVVVACPNAGAQASPEGPRGTIVVSNMRDNTATVIDVASSRVLATLPTGQGPHEVAMSHDGRWAVVSNYGPGQSPGNSLTVIDVPAATVARTIDLGTYRRPHGMAFLPGDSLIAVTSEVSQSVLLVSFRDGRVVAALPTKGRATHMVALPAAGHVFFTTNIADGTISRLDTQHPDNPTVIPVAKYPEGITITPDGQSVWVGSNGDSLVVVVDARAGTVVDTIKGFGMPYRLGITPDGRLAVVSDPIKGQIRVFDVANRHQRFLIEVPKDSLVTTAEVPGSPSPEGVTTSRDSRWAFVTLQGRNRVVTIDLARGTIIAYAPTGTWSDGIAYSPLRHGS